MTSESGHPHNFCDGDEKPTFFPRVITIRGKHGSFPGSKENGIIRAHTFRSSTNKIIKIGYYYFTTDLTSLWLISFNASLINISPVISPRDVRVM